jgi:hypothetical protein
LAGFSLSYQALTVTSGGLHLTNVVRVRFHL